MQTNKLLARFEAASRYSIVVNPLDMAKYGLIALSNNVGRRV